MSGFEPLLGAEWLQTVLTGDATLAGYAPGGVWRSYVPPGTAWPYVVHNYQAGSDVNTFNAIRVMDSLLYQVIVSGPSSMDTTLALAVAEIDKLLKRPAYVQTSDGLGAMLAAYRETPILKDSLVNGEKWTDMGGLYRVLLQQTS